MHIRAFFALYFNTGGSIHMGGDTFLNHSTARPQRREKGSARYTTAENIALSAAIVLNSLLALFLDVHCTFRILIDQFCPPTVPGTTISRTRKELSLGAQVQCNQAMKYNGLLQQLKSCTCLSKRGTRVMWPGINNFPLCNSGAKFSRALLLCLRFRKRPCVSRVSSASCRRA